MVGWPSEEDRIYTIKKMIKEKKAYIGFLKVSSDKDENEKIKKTILKEIEKKQEELEKFIKDNPLEEEPKEELSNVDVPLNPTFQNDKATPELWNPEKIKEKFDLHVYDNSYFEGFLRLTPNGTFGQNHNDYYYNILSLTPGLGLYKDKSQILAETIRIEALLFETLDSDNSRKYGIISIKDDNKPILITHKTPGVYLIDSRFNIDATVASPWNVRPFNTGYKSLPKLQAAIAGFLDTREGSCNGDLRLITVKTEDDYFYASPIIGIKLSGLVHVN